MQATELEVELSEFEVGGARLAGIHASSNKKKFFCHFTGFLEGVAVSGALETGEVAPLIAECEEFVSRIADEDALEILEDFKIQLLEHDVVALMVEVRVSEIDPTCGKSKLNRFLGFCRGLVCDGIVTLQEAQGVLAFLDANPDLLDVVGVRQVQVTCIDAVADGILSAHESEEICDAIGAIVGDSYGDTGLSQAFGVSNYNEYRFKDFMVEIEGASVCLTGKFTTSPRSVLENELASLGAKIVRSVSSKTDYLFIGGEASRDWIELNRGTKIRKAQDLRLNNENPKFVSESQVLRSLRG